MAKEWYRWTERDERTLKTFYRNNSCLFCAGMLRRSVDAVRKHASRLGLRKTKKYMREELHRRG